MGLEASIEKIFRRAMESDLELIAQNVSAQTSSNTTPQGSCMCACNISATVIQNTAERPEDQLYSVKRIEFQAVDFPEIMDKRIEEANAHQAAGHGPHLDSLGILLNKGPSIKNADAKLLARNKVLGLIGALARHYQDEGPYVTIVVRGDVLTLGVVDYVLETLLPAAINKLVQTNALRITEIPSLERWPEEVAIGARIYRRADLFKPAGHSTLAPTSPGTSGHPGKAPWTLRQVVAEAKKKKPKKK